MYVRYLDAAARRELAFEPWLAGQAEVIEEPQVAALVRELRAIDERIAATGGDETRTGGMTRIRWIEALRDPSELPLPLRPDVVLSGKYRLLRRLDRAADGRTIGGMGEVWLAAQLDLGRNVALKFVRERPSSPLDDERLRNEARMMARPAHDAIAAIYDICEGHGRNWIVQEYVEGQTLRSHIEHLPRPLSRRDSWRAPQLFTQIAEGLAAAHARDVVHRDIKPDNVVLSADGKPKIIDFGIALLRTDEAPLGLTGSIEYMSPEQVSLGSYGIDARTDVFSLGVVLYEYLTGRRPFQGPSRRILRQIATEPAPPFDRSSAVPASLRRVCLRCLEKNPNDRYQSMSDLARDLRRCRPRRALRTAAAAATVCVAILVLFGLGLLPPGQELGAMPVPSQRDRINVCLTLGGSPLRSHGASVLDLLASQLFATRSSSAGAAVSITTSRSPEAAWDTHLDEPIDGLVVLEISRFDPGEAAARFRPRFHATARILRPPDTQPWRTVTADLASDIDEPTLEAGLTNAVMRNTDFARELYARCRELQAEIERNGRSIHLALFSFDRPPTAMPALMQVEGPGPAYRMHEAGMESLPVDAILARLGAPERWTPTDESCRSYRVELSGPIAELRAHVLATVTEAGFTPRATDFYANTLSVVTSRRR